MENVLILSKSCVLAGHPLRRASNKSFRLFYVSSATEKGNLNEKLTEHSPLCVWISEQENTESQSSPRMSAGNRFSEMKPLCLPT